MIHKKRVKADFGPQNFRTANLLCSILVSTCLEGTSGAHICFGKSKEVWFYNCLYINSGHVRGGSRGSTDPPKILEPIDKKLEIEILS